MLKFILKKTAILLVLLLFFSHIAQAMENNDYLFNPADPRHTLFIPPGKGPFPAVLLLHPSLGIKEFQYDLARNLQNHGYVVYIIDSFTPRGIKDRKSVGWEKATKAQLADIAPAYHYLASLKVIDPKKIGLLGFSMGGYSALKSLQTNSSDISPRLADIPFKAVAAFYPRCIALPKTAKLKNIPLHIFIGDNDDRATTTACVELAKQQQANNNHMFITLYPQGLHGFDVPTLPATAVEIDESGEQYHLGYNKNIAMKAHADLLIFLDHYLKK